MRLQQLLTRQFNNCVSCIGHADTARVLSTLLQREIPCNRVTVNLGPNEKCIIAQYIGPRLPEGATVLPEGAEIRFYLVKMEVKEKYLKMISLQKDISNLAYDIAGWGVSIDIDEVKKVLEKHFPHYFCEHAFD